MVSWAGRIANIGSTPTCVRSNGSSIIDLTWTTPDLADKIRNWEENTETLSDHAFIKFEVGRVAATVA